jgi:uncharacterized membrane protein YhaH (DUF805 family)
MDISYLYASFEGRIARKSFWLALIALAVVSLAILVASVLAVGEQDYFTIRFNAFVITILFLYPLIAVAVKRLHDRGRPGYTVIVFVVPWLVHQVTNLLGITGDPTALTSLDLLFYGVNVVMTIWFVVDLGCLRGTRAPNQYGPDPLEAVV